MSDEQRSVPACGAVYVHGRRRVTVEAAPVHDALNDRLVVLFAEDRARRAMPLEEFVETFRPEERGIADEDC